MAIQGGVPQQDRRFSGRGCLLAVLLLGAVIPAAGEPQHSTAAAEVAFTHGVLAFESGDFAQAAVLFEEAVRWDPREGTARHWLGITYLKLARYAAAVRELDASLDAPRPPVAGLERVMADLNRARALRDNPPGSPPEVKAPSVEVDVDLPLNEASRVNGRIGLEVGRDTNPGLLPTEILGIPPFGTHPPRRSADSFTSLDLRIADTPWMDRRGWSLGLSLSASQSFHQDLHNLDLTYGQGVVSLVHGSDLLGFVDGPLGTVRVPQRPGRWSAVLQAEGSILLLDGDRFVSTAGGAGSILFPGRTGAARLDLEIRDRRYGRDGFSALRRSGTEISLGASHSFRTVRWDGSLRLGANAGRRDAGQAFAGSFGQAFAEISAPLREHWTLFLVAARREDRFAHSVSNLGDPLGDPRRDRIWRLTGASVWALSERLRWTVRASWTDRHSNVTANSLELLDYRRTVIASGLAWFF